MKTKYNLLVSLARYIFIVFILFFSASLVASPTLILNETQTSYTDFDISYFVEKDNRYLDIEDIQKVSFDKYTSNKINLGYVDNEVWFHFKIKNTTPKPKNMILEFTEIFHDTVELYTLLSSGEIDYIKNGLHIPMSHRKIKEPTPSFHLLFEANETKDIYLKIMPTHGLFGSIVLKEEKQFNKDIQSKKYLYFAYFIAILTIIVYNLIYFLYFRDKLYFYYILYVFLFAIWIANFKGLIFTFVDFELYNILQIVIPIFFISFLLFSKAILETKEHYIKLHKIYNSIIFISIAIIIGLIILPQITFYIMNVLAVPILLITFGSSLWFLDKKNIIVKFYIVALSIFTLGMLIMSALALGFVPYSILTSNIVMIVSIFEIILFSLLMAYRINLVRNESLEARERLLEQQKTESTRLFHTVAEKTKELNIAKKELEEELRKKIELEKHLQHLASTDSMTELYNRRAFFDISNMEISRAKINGEKLTCLIIDIDYFKKINDTYGHDVGDKVIVAVSKLMVLNTRSKDRIGRIGGEEFAVLMPKTSTEAAYQIADRLRENISKHSISLNGYSEVLKITISIGLSTMKIEENESVHTLLKRADNALYKAKENGRNQVCCLPAELS